MQPNFDPYRAIGQRFVTGFLQPEILVVLDVLNAAQRTKQVSGAVAEIGVHHGKLFIGLRLLQRRGEKSVAIDIFGDQELNVDGSGHAISRSSRTTSSCGHPWTTWSCTRATRPSWNRRSCANSQAATSAFAPSTAATQKKSCSAA